MIITLKPGDNIMEALAAAGALFVCGGMGVCGKCAVRVLSGNVPVTAKDRAYFNEDELEAGMRLACGIESIDEDIEIETTKASLTEVAETTETAESTETIEKATKTEATESPRFFNLAIDIGTTTIAVAAVEALSGRVISAMTDMNSQRMYGADVISRIAVSESGLAPKLRSLVMDDIDRLTNSVMTEAGLKIEGLERIIITGNTVMEHIFAGYSLKGLGSAPFKPVSLDETETPSGILMPGISAYVGADVLAGMYATGAFENDDISLFIDIGTNGEMAIGNKEKILVASTAAGPALEGGNISCGIAVIPGAIFDVQLDDSDDAEPVKLKIIGDNEENRFPCGICGTGVIALVSELLDNGLLDRNGLLDERLNGKVRLLKGTEGQNKSIVFTQKDIREVQLAKAAIRAGIETIMKEYGVEAETIAKVYIAGSFGNALDLTKAARIGLIPEEFISKCVMSGNAALKGAVLYSCDRKAKEKLEALKARCSEIVLADNDCFAELFVKNMNCTVKAGQNT